MHANKYAMHTQDARPSHNKILVLTYELMDQKLLPFLTWKRIHEQTCLTPPVDGVQDCIRNQNQMSSGCKFHGFMPDFDGRLASQLVWPADGYCLLL